MPSHAEQVLVRMVAAIVEADTAAADRVERNRTDTPAVDDTPNVSIRRGGGAFEPFTAEADASGLDVVLELWASGSDWEAQADALHLEVHAALRADAPLQRLVRSLRCVGTDSLAAAAEVPLGRLVVTYRTTALVSQSDLTRHFNP